MSAAAFSKRRRALPSTRTESVPCDAAAILPPARWALRAAERGQGTGDQVWAHRLDRGKPAEHRQCRFRTDRTLTIQRHHEHRRANGLQHSPSCLNEWAIVVQQEKPI